MQTIKAAFRAEKANPDVSDPKATKLQMSSSLWSDCCCQLRNRLSAGKDSRSHISSYCSENNLSAHHLDRVDKIIVPSSVRQKVPGVWRSNNIGHDAFLLKLNLSALTLVGDTVKVVVTFHGIGCFLSNLSCHGRCTHNLCH